MFKGSLYSIIRFRSRLLPVLILPVLAASLMMAAPQSPRDAPVFPGKTWETRKPEEVGLDEAKLRALAKAIGGDGVVVRDGYLVHAWGKPARRGDWASAAKPVISTLLLFAVHERVLKSVDDPVRIWVKKRWPGKDLVEKDRAMTFRHLADMTSGYARAEAPGSHWAYNDVAINLYRHLMQEVFGGATLNEAMLRRLKPLQFEDGGIFGSRSGGGVNASPRDFARIGWFWLNKGNWNGDQLLPASYFDKYCRPHVPRNLPRTKAPGKDYLRVGSYGGGTDQDFSGPGVYGLNWWFNAKMARPDEHMFPHLPKDAFAAIGHNGREVMLVIPSLRIVLAARGNWGDKRLPKSRTLMEAIVSEQP